MGGAGTSGGTSGPRSRAASTLPPPESTTAPAVRETTTSPSEVDTLTLVPRGTVTEKPTEQANGSHVVPSRVRTLPDTDAGSAGSAPACGSYWMASGTWT